MSHEVLLISQKWFLFFNSLCRATGYRCFALQNLGCICKSISLKDFKVYGSLCSCLLLLTNGRLPPDCHHVVVLAFSLRAWSGGVACFSSFKNSVPHVGPSTSRRVVSACETNRLQHRCCYLPCMAVSRLARDAHMSRRRPTATRTCPYNPRRFKQ